MIKLGKRDVFDERCRVVVYLLGGEVSSRRFYLAKRKSDVETDDTKSSSSEYYDGYGGLYKTSDGDIYATAIRKLQEKAGRVRVSKKKLVLMGRVKIFLPENMTDIHDREVFFFVSRGYSGYPEETKKMGKPSLYGVYDAPFQHMRPTDGLIMRPVLSGKVVRGSVHLATNKCGERVVLRSDLVVAPRKDIP